MEILPEQLRTLVKVAREYLVIRRHVDGKDNVCRCEFVRIATARCGRLISIVCLYCQVEAVLDDLEAEGRA